MNIDENYGRIFLPSELQFDCKFVPLIITRRSSQVCQAWRDIILGSPSIWASCIDLDVLNQKDDCWRNLVLQRTGQAMLSVTGPNSCESEPETRRTSDCWKFVVKLLQENWSRIRVLNIAMSFFQPHNSPVLEVISRPAKNLRVFQVQEDLLRHPLALCDFPATLQLFSGNAPSLKCLSLGTFHDPFNSQATPVVFGNLQNLKLRLGDLDAFQFLEACHRMPFLEELDIHILGLEIGQENLPRPSMTKLAIVSVDCPSPNVYTFIDYILPVTGCKLHSTHNFHYRTQQLADRRGLAGLQCIIERYGKHFSSNHEKRTVDFTLTLDTTSCVFFCSDDLLSIHLDYSDIERFKQVIMQLINTISAVKLSGATNRFIFHLVPEFIHSLSHSNLLGFLISMPWITNLVLHLSSLSLIRELSGNNILFPSLKTLTFFTKGHVEDLRTDLRADVIPFLHHQSTNTPLEVLDLSSSMWKHDELCLLDAFAGLNIIWMENGEMHEYTCGSRSGEGWDLLNIDAVATSPSDLDAALAAW